ncbi:MAG: glycosyltransferase family 2 protein [bacterium]|nr:glycosyl transferase family 2 [Deltaproteobacteria bacterium]MCP4904157.1 glycosyltransferase family 2 protein [bacterium]
MSVQPPVREARGDGRSVLIIMPARNEAERIAPVIREVRECLPDAQVLVIDDGSSDSTPEVAREAGALVARLPFHLGYGGALQTGYRFAVAKGFDFVVQMDSDGQHRPVDLPQLLELVARDECDLAIGSRFAREAESSGLGPRYEMGMLRSIGRRTLCFFARVGGLRVTDPTSGLQAMNARTLELFASSLYPVDYPDVDVLLLAHRRGLRVRERAVEMNPSPRPSMLHSGWMPIYYAYRMLLSLWALSAVPRSRSSDSEALFAPGSGGGESGSPGGCE